MTSILVRPTHRVLLGIAVAVAIVSIGVLWPPQRSMDVCPLIYPAPPECGGYDRAWISIAAIAIVIALLSAIVVVYFTVSQRRVLLIVLIAAMVAVTVIAEIAVAIPATPVWPPPLPVDPLK